MARASPSRHGASPKWRWRSPTARLLSNYIVNSIACKMDDLKEHGNLFNNVPFEERLKDLVDDMKEWTEFKFGDPRFKEIGQKLAQRQNAYIQEVINQPNKFSEKHKDDISKVGTATIAQRTTIDLTQKPLPVVTDVTFSQTFSPDEIRLTSDQ